MPTVTGGDLTIPEAAEFLEPPLTVEQWRLLIRLACLEPVGRRGTGQAGRPWPTYPAAALMRLHAAVAPVLLRLHSPAAAACIPAAVTSGAT